MRRTSPEENLPPIHLPGWPTHTPASNEGTSPTASTTTAPNEKVYIVPPFSFSFNFGPFKGHPFSSTGFSAKDLPWADKASKVFSWLAAGLDAASLALSVWDLGASVDPTRATPTAGALAATVVGASGALSTNLADIFGGNTGWVCDSDRLTGYAIGRDSLVADRNLVLGTAAAWAADAAQPGLGTAIAVGGVYVAASQLDYDVRGLVNHEGGGSVVFRSVTDGAAWNEAWHEVTGHWAAQSELTAVGAAAIGQGQAAVQSAADAIHRGVSAVQSGAETAGKAVGEHLREVAERLGHSAPTAPPEPGFKGGGGRSGGGGASSEY
jgi:hypothetical protein